MLRYLAFGAIALLILLRLARTRVGARLLGVPLRVLEIVHLVALVVTGILALVLEQWFLLGAVVVLLVIGVVEELRRRCRGSRPLTDPGRVPRRPRSRR